MRCTRDAAGRRSIPPLEEVRAGRVFLAHRFKPYAGDAGP
jgi:hypothetical protein